MGSQSTSYDATYIVGPRQPVRGVLVDCPANYRLDIALERLEPDNGRLEAVSLIPPTDPLMPQTTEFSLTLRPAFQGMEGVASVSCSGAPFRLDLRVWDSIGYKVVLSATCDAGLEVSYSQLAHLDAKRLVENKLTNGDSV